MNICKTEIGIHKKNKCLTHAWINASFRIFSSKFSPSRCENAKISASWLLQILQYKHNQGTAMNKTDQWSEVSLTDRHLSRCIEASVIGQFCWKCNLKVWMFVCFPKCRESENYQTDDTEHCTFGGHHKKAPFLFKGLN